MNKTYHTKVDADLEDLHKALTKSDDCATRELIDRFLASWTFSDDNPNGMLNENWPEAWATCKTVYSARFGDTRELDLHELHIVITEIVRVNRDGTLPRRIIRPLDDFFSLRGIVPKPLMVIIDDIAALVHMSSSSLTGHIKEWGPPNFPKLGTRAAKWEYQTLKPKLKEQFGHLVDEIEKYDLLEKNT